MQKKGAKIAAGVGLGMAIGGMTAAIGTSMMTGSMGKTPIKKKAAKAIRSMEDMLDSLQIMLK